MWAIATGARSGRAGGEGGEEGKQGRGKQDKECDGEWGLGNRHHNTGTVLVCLNPTYWDRNASCFP